MALSEKDLGKDYTPEYESPLAVGDFSYYNHINPNRPRFRYRYIPLMMRDPRIQFGLAALKGRILQRVTFSIDTYDSQAGDIIDKSLNRFWENGASTTLEDMMVYGFSGSEVMYYQDENTGDWCYDKLKYIAPTDCKPVSRSGQLIGMNVYYNNLHINNHDPQFIPNPKTLWAVHRPQYNKWFGQTRLYGCFEPWWEKWCYRGARDSRALWFYRSSHQGLRIGYPQGASPVEYGSTGTNAIKKIPNRQIAMEMADRSQQGGSIIYPVAPAESGNQWEFEDAKSLTVPEGLSVYMDDLDRELLEGLGVPPEVLTSDGEGAYAGRQVPNEAFISVLEDPAKWLKNCFCEGVCDPLIYLALGRRVRYDVKVEGLVESLPTASDGMFPSDVADHQEAVADGTAGDPTNFTQPTKPIVNNPQRKTIRAN